MSHIRGRFHKGLAEAAAEYSALIPFDWVLFRQDIAGSMTHARMLAKQGIISADDADAIVRGLESIRKEIEQGKFNFDAELEDIHMNIEARLIKKIGEAGRKLHTARSRNDQVALDMRLFTRQAVADALRRLTELQRAIIDLAEANKSVVMPGYTHLQPAQPVLLAHHLLAYFEMFLRDADRFNDCLKRSDVMPLGSGALAGVSYDIDRDFVARELGFIRVTANSMDAVSDRDFVIEYEAAASICMMHLSRLAEEIILWSSAEFDFIELDESYSTGSSIMPQKRNPDIAELGRGKTGRVYGHLLAMLTTMKGLPLTYNRDLQEDKEGLFDTVCTLLSTLEVFTGMLSTLKVKAGNTRQRAEEGYMLATDIADYLVSKGESFRNAHAIVAKLVTYAAEKGKTFSQLTQAEYKKFSPKFGKDIRSVSVESSLAARNMAGGTAPAQVKTALAEARKIVDGPRGGRRRK